MKILIITTVMAPYRIELFEELGKNIDLVVCFEDYFDETRDKSWYNRAAENFDKIISSSKSKIKLDVLRQIKKEFDVVIFYEYSTLTSVIGIYKCQLNNIPYIINCDGAFISRESLAKYNLKKSLISNASGLLANGASAIQYFLYYKAPTENIFQHDFSSLKSEDFDTKPVTNFLNLLETNYKIDLKHMNIFLSVGRFIESKNIEFLISNWKEMGESDILCIVGNGTDKKKYRDMVSELKLKNVFILNHLSKEELFSFYQISKALLFPSYNEVWGLVVPEALSQGLPVITTVECNAGTQLIINGKNGFIVSNRDFKMWKESIDIILNDKENIFPTYCKQSVIGLTIKNNASQIINICKQLMGIINE